VRIASYKRSLGFSASYIKKEKRLMIADVIVFWREGLKTTTSQKEVEDEFA